MFAVTAERLFNNQTYEELQDALTQCCELAEAIQGAIAMYEAEFATWTKIRIRARRGRAEAEPYLGFGARFIDDETFIIHPDHVEWIRARLGSGLIGSEIVE